MSTRLIEILLIEDDEVDRTQVRRLLDTHYRLQEAPNGKIGRAILANPAHQPDLILLDYRLPDVNSFELLRMAVSREIPVIVLTGEERPGVIVEAMQEGALDYLLKVQLTKETLHRALDNALEKAQLKQSVAIQQRQIALQAQALANQNRQIRDLASAVTLAEQRERKRVAQILHDHVQQLLYGVQMRLHLLNSDLSPNTAERITQNLMESKRLLEEAIGATRSLAVDLSPPMLHDEGLDVALKWLAAHMGRVHGLHINLHLDETNSYLVANEDLYVLIFQLVRELLFNVIKHAHVNQASLHLYTDDQKQKITVEDEGVGFEAGQILQPRWQPEKGYGLYSVSERLALFGGSLQVDSQPGHGTRATIILPDQLVYP